MKFYGNVTATDTVALCGIGAEGAFTALMDLRAAELMIANKLFKDRGFKFTGIVRLKESN